MTMETLKLEHIAPYLPYGLKYNLKERSKHDIRELDASTLVYKNINRIQPILHPLSDLTKPIQHNGEEFAPFEYWNEIGLRSSDSYILNDAGQTPAWINGASWNVMQKLFEWHFNVFNLPDYLWIDVNILENNPYK